MRISAMQNSKDAGHMIDRYAIRVRCKLCLFQSLPFRLLAWLADGTVPEKPGFGRFRGRDD
jgi:hypothetical protein